ncbi:uncharacterized protein LOC110711329 [Chenopodium quinoa]|uniref:uncharacterized protein LOC110711329 n=1 Tax=Chenopodium quinoa TaxID=63459 RepID=UPI000B7797E8|nr:uncharacterized protein LOC110711329 [Chenopodium quinoa]
MAGGSSTNNEGNELSKVVRQLAAVAQQLARNSTCNGDAQGKLFKKVAQSKPPTYQEEPYPTILENWLREFEKLFGVVGCLENSKVRCATYYLRGKADHWWQQNETTIRALPGFNWAKFQEKDGKVSVTEYYTKFIELFRFSEEYVATEKEKARKFESGLTTDFQLKLCGQVFETLDEVYGRAAHLYTLEEKKKKELAEIEGREKRKEVGQVYGNNRQGGRNNNGGTKHHNQVNNKNGRTYFCKRCKNNHPCRDCEGNLVACRACNKLGNREYECFSKNTNGNRQNNNSRGNQWNFQENNNNFNGNKKVQQNGVKNNNNYSGNNQHKGGAAGKLNVLSRHETDSTKDVITCIVSKLKDCIGSVEVVDLPITIPTCEVVKCTKTYKNVPLEIKGKVFLSDLIEFGLSDFDLILGMDWFSKYNAEISCRSQKVKMVTNGKESITYWMHGETKCPRLISVQNWEST